MKKRGENHEKLGKIMKQWKKIVKNDSGNIFSSVGFWDMSFEIILFGKKYIRQMSIRGKALEIMTVNNSRQTKNPQI